MPTVVLVDRSLSMCRRITAATGERPYPPTRFNLAKKAVDALFDHIYEHLPYEYCALLSFSGHCEVLQEFTNARDYSLMKKRVAELELGDKTCLAEALEVAVRTVKAHFGGESSCQFVVVTEALDAALALPAFPFPVKVHLLCLGDDLELSQMPPVGLPVFSWPANVNGGVLGAVAAVGRMADVHFKPYAGTLSYGSLSTKISLCPPPAVFAHTASSAVASLPRSLPIVGFYSVDALQCPPILERCIILPELLLSQPNVLEPDFRPLLHSALKSSRMAGVVQLGEAWFGFVYAWQEGKKSNLMLAVLRPRASLPWLGDLSEVVRLSDSLDQPMTESMDTGVPSADHFSYSTKPSSHFRSEQSLKGLVQKVLRYAKHFAAKREAFYREANRLRVLCRVYGMVGLLDKASAVMIELAGALPEAEAQAVRAAAAQLRDRTSSKPIAAPT